MSRRSRGFSLIELLVVLAIILIMLGLVSQGICLFRDACRARHCANNQRVLGIALHQYISSFSRAPTAAAMMNDMGPYLGGAGDVYRCPSACTPGTVDYGATMCLERMVDDAGKIVLADAYDSPLYWSGRDQLYWDGTIAPRHHRWVNVLHFDGSVQTVSPAGIDPYDEFLRNGDLFTNTGIRDRLWKPRRGCGADPAPDCAGGGLVGEYWSDSIWARSKGGPPDIVRVDKSLNEPFGGAFEASTWGPYPFPLNRTPSDRNGNGLPDCAFQVRWRGYVYVPCSGRYTFYVRHDDNCWVDVDGRNVFYRYCCGWATGATVSLSAGWKPIEIRYDNDRWREDYLQVQWSSDCGVSRRAIEGADLKCP